MFISCLKTVDRRKSPAPSRFQVLVCVPCGGCVGGGGGWDCQEVAGSFLVINSVPGGPSLAARGSLVTRLLSDRTGFLPSFRLIRFGIDSLHPFSESSLGPLPPWAGDSLAGLAWLCSLHLGSCCSGFACRCFHSCSEIRVIWVGASP